MDIAEFLTARLDEDERRARAATPGPWSYNPGAMWLGPEAFERFDRSKGEEYVAYGGPPPFTGCIAATGDADHPQSMADAAHIACHNPARVRREVEIKRGIIKLYQANAEAVRNWTGPGAAVLPFEVSAKAYFAVLRLLAAAYVDHPDYKASWKP